MSLLEKFKENKENGIANIYGGEERRPCETTQGRTDTYIPHTIHTNEDGSPKNSNSKDIFYDAPVGPNGFGDAPSGLG